MFLLSSTRRSSLEAEADSPEFRAHVDRPHDGPDDGSKVGSAGRRCRSAWQAAIRVVVD